jgi:hypothetical protein
MVANKKSGAQGVKGKRIVVKHEVATKTRPTAEAIMTIDRRDSSDRRSTSDRRMQSMPVAVERRTLQRRVKVNRRRQIDPTTCERDYTSDEIEFMSAMDDYKRRNGRMFPTCSEVLEVVKLLGYEKRPATVEITPPSLNLPVMSDPIPTAV